MASKEGEGLAPKVGGAGGQETMELDTDILFQELKYKALKSFDGSTVMEALSAAKDKYSVERGVNKFKEESDDKKYAQIHQDLIDFLTTASSHPLYQARVKAECEAILGEKTTAREWLTEQLEMQSITLVKALKLFLLITQSLGGIKSEHLVTLSKEFCHSFGYETVEIFTNLQKLGLLDDEPARSKNGLKAWKTLCKKKNLVMGPVAAKDLAYPTDISHLFPDSGYAPYSIRVLQELLGIGSNAGADKEFLGTEVSQLTQRAGKDTVVEGHSPVKAAEGETVIVYFIGGITLVEEAAIKFLSAKSGVNIIAACTSVVNGDAILRSLGNIA